MMMMMMMMMTIHTLIDGDDVLFVHYEDGQL